MLFQFLSSFSFWKNISPHLFALFFLFSFLSSLCTFFLSFFLFYMLLFYSFFLSIQCCLRNESVPVLTYVRAAINAARKCGGVCLQKRVTQLNTCTHWQLHSAERFHFRPSAPSSGHHVAQIRAEHDTALQFVHSRALFYLLLIICLFLCCFLFLCLSCIWFYMLIIVLFVVPHTSHRPVCGSTR